MPFIESFKSHLLAHSSTDPLWAETIATVLLGSIAHNVRYEDVKGNVRLNEFALIIGPSGLAEKTTPIDNVVTPILDEVDERMEEQFALMNPNDTPAQRRRRAGRQAEEDAAAASIQQAADIERFLIPNRYSYEGLLTLLTKRKLRRGIILDDEFSDLIKSVEGKTYMASTMEGLSNLYDGKFGHRITYKHGVEKVRRVSMSLLSATTPYIYRVLQPDIFLQGTANRFLFIVYDESVPARTYSPQEYYGLWGAGVDQTFDTEDKNAAFSQQILSALSWFDAYQMVGNRISHTNRLRLTPTEPAAITMLEYINQLKTEAKELYVNDHTGYEYGYITKMELHVNKLAGILCLDRLFDMIASRSPELEQWKYLGEYRFNIENDEAKRAVELSKIYVSHFRKLTAQWKEFRQIQEQPVFTHGALLEMIKSELHRFGGKMLRGDLLRHLKITARDLNEALNMSDEFHNDIERDRDTGRERQYIKLSDTNSGHQ